MPQTLSRRAFLARSTLIGCSLAASPLVTPLSFAAAQGENRLVVIILRGGMDGLDVLRPYGDPAYAALRGDAGLDGAQGAADLDGFYALHPALRPLLPLWRRGHLGFAHAVSTPYRDKRSHFDGQDLLEAGLPALAGRTQGGWLNRALEQMPEAVIQTAYAIGSDGGAILRGPAPHMRWSPEAQLSLSPQAIALARMIMQDDPAFDAAFAQAVQIIAGEDAAQTDPALSASGKDAPGPAARIAAFTATRLQADTRIASFSLNGWDTHQNQHRSLPRALSQLSETILTLQDALPGDVWAKTTVVAVTEFGRTARINGTGGTDHGTGGLMVLAGGALNGGRVMADWPGLGEGALYAQRDLMPTRDLRAYLAWLLHSRFGIAKTALETAIFPGLHMGAAPAIQG